MAQFETGNVEYSVTNKDTTLKDLGFLGLHPCSNNGAADCLMTIEIAHVEELDLARFNEDVAQALEGQRVELSIEEDHARERDVRRFNRKARNEGRAHRRVEHKRLVSAAIVQRNTRYNAFDDTASIFSGTSSCSVSSDSVDSDCSSGRTPFGSPPRSDGLTSLTGKRSRAVSSLTDDESAFNGMRLSVSGSNQRRSASSNQLPSASSSNQVPSANSNAQNGRGPPAVTADPPTLSPGPMIADPHLNRAQITHKAQAVLGLVGRWIEDMSKHSTHEMQATLRATINRVPVMFNLSTVWKDPSINFEPKDMVGANAITLRALQSIPENPAEETLFTSTLTFEVKGVFWSCSMGSKKANR